jgi:RimJ/RimL family protein N-acetyltransferase
MHILSDMRLNYETCIVGERCVLVPYRKEHVAQYHSWMQDSALLEATGSEPLSLEQEYEMQEQWRDDEEKCTFIIVARNNPGCIWNSYSVTTEETDDFSDENWIQKSLPAMVGDVNLFLSPEENDDMDGEDQDNKAITVVDEISKKYSPKYQAELDIMVAESNHRGQGIGREASLMMMLYAATHLHIRRFFCKINQDNHASLHLFRDKLGFHPCAYAECFRQFELEFRDCTHQHTIDRIVTLLGRSTLTNAHCPTMKLRTESIEPSGSDNKEGCVIPIRTELLEEQPCTDE